MKVAIVDDEKFYLQRIARIVKDTLKEEAVCYSDVETFKKDATHYTLVLLDISMPDGDGIVLAQELRQMNCAIIFVTTMKERMQEAFGKHVEGFIIKANLEEALPGALLRVQEAFQKEAYFVYTNEAGLLTKIKLTDIYYIDIDCKEVYLHTNKQKYYIPCMTLKECFQQVDACFIYASRHMILNSIHMRYINKRHEIILDNDEIVYTNRYCCKKVREKFAEMKL